MKSDAMKCTQYLNQMSQCLDGRLPAGTLSALLAHLDQCGTCTNEWSSLRAAQELALKLPVFPVSAGFRSSLWDRIRSGEAGPDVAAMDPVSPWAKVRWFAAGVCAAAAVLVFVHLLQPLDASPSTGEGESSGIEVAQRDTAPVIPDTPHVRPAPAHLAGGQLVPLSAAEVANFGAETAYRSARHLRIVADTLERQDHSPARDVTELRAEVTDQANIFLASSNLMRRMHNSGIIVLPNDMLEQFGRIESSLSSFEQAKSLPEIGIALRGLRLAEPEQLSSTFSLRSCFNCDLDRQFQTLLNEWILRDPSAPRFFSRMQMQIVVQPQGQLAPGETVQVHVLHTSNGGSSVRFAPRAKLRESR